MRRVRSLAAAVLAALVSAGSAASGEGPFPPAPENPAQSWVAYFHLSGHVFRVGDTVTGTITIPPIGDCGKGHRCVTGFYGLGGAGLKPIGPCDMKHRTCRWKAVAETDGWQVMSLQIQNNVGPAHSDDFYLVVDPNTYVLDGTVSSRTSSTGVPGVKLGIAGKKKLTATTNANGYYAVALKKGAYTVTPSKAGEKGKFAPPRASVTVGPKGAKRDFLLKRAFRSDLYGVTKNGAQARDGDRIGAVDDAVSYIGDDWDPEGDHVFVYWNDKQLGDHSGAGKFSNQWSVPLFPDDSCKGRLKAVQGEVVKTVTLRAAKWGAVVFADKDVTAGLDRGDSVEARDGGRKLKTKSFLCEGEAPVLGAQATAIWMTEKAFVVENRPKGIKIRGSVSSPDIRMALSGGRAYTLAVRGNAPAAYDPAGRSGVFAVGPVLEGATTLSGFGRADGDLRVKGPLRLDGSVLYVAGNLTVDAGISGKGAVVVVGSATIRGPVDLVTDNIAALVTGGTLVLYGK